MSRDTCDSRAPLSQWGAEILRLTVFHSATKLPNAEEIWSRTVGQEADSSLVKPKTGEHIFIVSAIESQIIMNVQSRQNRLDWMLSADAAYPIGSASWHAQIAKFGELMSRFLAENLIPEITRLAFGAVAVLPVSDATAGYSTLSNYLRFNIDRNSSSDFLYQINRRRNLNSVTGVGVNRLSKWSVTVTTRNNFALTGNGIVLLQSTGDTHSFCSVELDINTIPDASDGRIPGDLLPQAYSELAHLAEEILMEGDID